MANVDPVIISRAIFSVSFVLALYLARMAIRRIIERKVEDPTARLTLLRLVNYSAIGLGLVTLGIIWLERLGGFSVALGLLAAGAAFSMRETITSFAGWLLITSGQAYRLGDRIEMAGIEGDVIGFGLLRTTMMEIRNWVQGDQYTGRVVTVSNSAVFQQPLYNYTRHFNFIWDEIHIPITFQSNWRQACDISLKLAEKHSRPILQEAKSEWDQMSRHYLVSNGGFSPSVYVSFNSNWIEISVRYLAPVRQRRMAKDKLARDLLTAIAEAPDITVGSETIMLQGVLGVQEMQARDRRQ